MRRDRLRERTASVRSSAAIRARTDWTVSAAGSKSPSTRERDNDLAARLHDFTEIDEGRLRRRMPSSSFELADGASERLLALVKFPLRDRPGAIVLLRPERTAGMREQHFERRPCPRYIKMPALQFGHRTTRLNAKNRRGDNPRRFFALKCAKSGSDKIVQTNDRERGDQGISMTR